MNPFIRPIIVSVLLAQALPFVVTTNTGPVITQSDVSLGGYFTIPGGTNPHPNDPGASPLPYIGGPISTCGRASMDNLIHCFSLQEGQSGYYGYYSLIEYIVPTSLGSTPDTATPAIYYRNWGYSSGALYEMWHGQYGYTYDINGNEVVLENTPFTPYPAGLGYHESGGHRYVYIQYGLTYGNPPNNPPPWNWVTCELVNPGTGDANQTGLSTICSSPQRICAGTGTYGGTSGAQGEEGGCGPFRGSNPTPAPDGKMCTSTGLTHTQNPPNWGPAIWCGADWPTVSTPNGFGSTRAGNAKLRTTDIVQTVDYLSHYQLSQGQVNLDGTLNGVPQWSGRRPSYATATLAPNPPGFKNYTYAGGTAITYGVTSNASEVEVDPDQYSGFGSWINGDFVQGMYFVSGTKTGVIGAGHFIVGPYWYKTAAGQQFSLFGTQPYKLMARNAAEAWEATGYSLAASPTLHADVRFNVKSAYYSSDPAQVVKVNYVNDGASQSFSCTVSGKITTIHLPTNSSSVITATANSLISSFNADSTCTTHMTAAISHVSDSNDAVTYVNNGTGTIPGLPTNNGFGIVLDGAHTGQLVLAHGPQLSPREDIDLGVSVTGPNGLTQPAMIVYDTATLGATPDYNVNPTSFIWLRLIDSNFPCATNASVIYTHSECIIGGNYYDEASRKFIVFTNGTDLTTAAVKPYGVVLNIAGSPEPEPVSIWNWLYHQAPNFVRSRLTKPINLVDYIRGIKWIGLN